MEPIMSVEQAVFIVMIVTAIAGITVTALAVRQKHREDLSKHRPHRH